MSEIVVTVPEDAPEAALERLRLALPDARVEATAAGDTRAAGVAGLEDAIAGAVAAAPALPARLAEAWAAAGGASLPLWIALALALGHAAERAVRALLPDGSPSPAGESPSFRARVGQALPWVLHRISWLAVFALVAVLAGRAMPFEGEAARAIARAALGAVLFARGLALLFEGLAAPDAPGRRLQGFDDAEAARAARAGRIVVVVVLVCGLARVGFTAADPGEVTALARIGLTVAVGVATIWFFLAIRRPLAALIGRATGYAGGWRGWLARNGAHLLVGLVALDMVLKTLGVLGLLGPAAVGGSGATVLIVVVAALTLAGIDAWASELAPDERTPLRAGLLALAEGAVVVGATVGLFLAWGIDPLTPPAGGGIAALLPSVIEAAAVVIVGLGKEVGGLLAGVALASTPYRETIAARLAPLRDFLLLFFFIALGSALDLSLLGAHVSGAIVFSLFVLIGNPLIVLAIMGAMGYRKRTGFLAGLTVAQISESSLIFVAMGVSLGHVQEDALGLVTMVGLVTIAASTYMITYSHQLYALFEPVLGIIERRGTPREPSTAGAHRGDRIRVVVFGLGRFGTAIGMRLKARGIRVLGVDFNPLAIRRWRELGLETEFGDATDPERMGDLPLERAEWVVSTVPIHPTGLSHEDSRTTLIQLTRAAGFRGRVAVASHHPADTETLLGAGADLVLEPFQDAADRAVDLLCGAPEEERTEIPSIETEEKQAS